MASITANGITIEYETAGDPADPTLLLVMGLGGQLTAWDDELVERLVKRGFYVVRHDNRDVGRSTWFDDAGVPDVLAAMEGKAQATYLLSDMADDAASLLGALGIGSAHVLGVSMGGMIVQSMAIRHPAIVKAMISVMSTTGAHSVGQPHPEAIQALLAPPPADRDAALDTAAKVWRVIGSPGFPFDEARVRRVAGAAYDRAFHPEGTARQMVAILSSPDRTPGLRSVECPTFVVHGEDDPLVDPSGGRATADAVPGAQLWMVPGMGHDLPPQLFAEVVERIGAHCLGA
ncbi:MAG: alpha/beta fold hydrolase [Acidimicrobiales bacterium]